MARGNSFRPTKNDRTEYKRLQSNVNQKINRTKKNYGVDLSEHKLPSFNDITSREQFNHLKQKAKSFTNRNNTEFQFTQNKYGVVASKKEINRLERESKLAINLAKKKQKETMKKLKNKPFTIGGEERGTILNKTKTMSVAEVTGISIPLPFNFDSVQSKGQLSYKKETLEKRSKLDYYNKKSETLKQNFIDTMKRAFNSDANDIVSLLEKIDATDFVELSIMFDELDIRTYGSKGNEGLNDPERMETAITYLESFLDGDIDMKLKNF